MDRGTLSWLPTTGDVNGRAFLAVIAAIFATEPLAYGADLRMKAAAHGWSRCTPLVIAFTVAAVFIKIAAGHMRFLFTANAA